MRLIVFFDLPQNSKKEKYDYRKFVDFLIKEGYIRIQYSIFTKLCIARSNVEMQKKLLLINKPNVGDIRYLIVSEKQYQAIKCLTKAPTIQEQITNTERFLVIGGNDEDK